MENVVGAQGVALRGPGLKLGHFDIYDMLFPFLAFVRLCSQLLL